LRIRIILMRIRIQLFTLMRIRILPFSDANPDPQHCRIGMPWIPIRFGPNNADPTGSGSATQVTVPTRLFLAPG
jgi:hypothetical protein